MAVKLNAAATKIKNGIMTHIKRFNEMSFNSNAVGVSEKLNITPITRTRLVGLSPIVITPEIKKEVEKIIFDETHRTVKEWINNSYFATVWDNEGYRGIVFKSEKEAIDQLLKCDIDFELESLEQLFSDVDLLVTNGINRSEAERLVKNRDDETTFKRLIQMHGPEFSYSQWTGKRFDLKNGYVFYY